MSSGYYTMQSAKNLAAYKKEGMYSDSNINSLPSERTGSGGAASPLLLTDLLYVDSAGIRKTSRAEDLQEDHKKLPNELT